MAKGGINLNPGADATLVAAATKAAMANVPHDLSGTFEAMAKSYDETMKSVAESWSSVIEKVAPLAVDMVKNAIKKDSLETQYGSNLLNRPASFGDEGILSKEEWTEQNKTTDPSADIGTYDEYLGDSPDTKISVSELLTNIRDEKKSLWGKNDPASKKRRIELKGEKEQIYSELEFLSKVDQVNVDLLKSGNFDEVATGQPSMVLAAAIQAYPTKSGKILEGPYKGYHVDLGDNANGEFTFTLKTPDGDIVTGENTDGTLQTGGDKPISVPSSGVGGILVTKYDEVRLKEMNKDILDPLLKSNVKDPNKINIKNKIRAYCNNENDLLGLMQMAIGAEEQSFVEQVNNPSPTSAAYFAGLGETKLKKLGAVDIDGDNDVDENDLFAEGEFAVASAENYAKIKSALLDKSNNNYSFKDTQNAFLAYAQKAGENMHNYIPKWKPTGNNNNQTQNPFGTKSIQIGDTWLSANDRLTRRNIIAGGKGGFSGIYGDYAPTKDGWTREQGDGPKPIDLYKMLQDEQLLLSGDVDPSIKKTEQQQKTTNYLPTDLIKTMGEMTNDKDIVNAFNEKYKDSKFKFDYTFTDNKEMVYVSYDGGPEKEFLVSGDLPKQIAAYMNFKNPKDGATMVWPSGKDKGKDVYAKGGKWYPVKK